MSSLKPFRPDSKRSFPKSSPPSPVAGTPPKKIPLPQLSTNRDPSSKWYTPINYVPIFASSPTTSKTTPTRTSTPTGRGVITRLWRKKSSLSTRDALLVGWSFRPTLFPLDFPPYPCTGFPSIDSESFILVW